MTGGNWQAFGVVPYCEGLGIQERVAAERARGNRPDTLLLLEHPPTITLGRRASEGDVLWHACDLERSGITVERVGRGGRATYHGPGQLVGYPIARLSCHGRGVRRFVAGLEGVLADVARRFGVVASARVGHPGVWVGAKKLGSIGIEIRGGVSRHGFALNVDMDLAPFQAIVPCGMPGLETTDLSREAGTKISIAAATGALLAAWQARFGILEEEAAYGCDDCQGECNDGFEAAR